MKEQIRQRAIELGFDDCRFASAAVPDAANEFQNWIAEKKYGEMAWIEKNANKRVEPQKVLSNAKTAICLAASYEVNQATVSAATAGIVARYARFDDYHDVVSERLKLLTQFINE